MKTCEDCGGRGEILVQVNYMPTFIFGLPMKRNYRKCETCNGSGQVEEKEGSKE
jgi:DnaJ-class molecular chaperone